MAVGVLAKFEFKEGNEAAVEQFFRQGQLVVEGQPGTTQWFAHRLGPTTYEAFAVFANDADRDALLRVGGPQSSSEQADLFERAPSFVKVDVVAARTAECAAQPTTR